MLLTRPIAAMVAACLAIAGFAPACLGQADAARTKAAAPARKPVPAPPATPVDKLKTAKGFQVELVYTVPRETQGSWVNLAVDPKGRLIASDQYGKLWRVTPPPVGATGQGPKVEAIPVELGEAQGLLWAFDSLYVVVNAQVMAKSGLYRVKDTDGDDVLDKVELLRKLDGNSEHGPHAVVLSPDGKSLYVVAGNATKLTELAGSLVPRVWGEDQLLPNMPDGRGFMRDEKAPGGWIARTDPDGKSWELASMGYRNSYDMAFNRWGDLFTYDSDMEWDMNTPWYRPTRICLAASGADFGYRNGAGKQPAYYPDTLPPVVNIGPGSPTGVTFGYGARFPAKYQEALFAADWSYGKLYAVHLKPEGSAYGANVEEFITGTPLPLTDMVVNPLDGALYFAIGGRKTTSGLYRVTYIGNESTALPEPDLTGSEARILRRSLEAFHGNPDPKALDFAWPYLSNPDRFVRFAARVAVETQDRARWEERALAETDPLASIEALLALTRVAATDPAHRSPTDVTPSKPLEAKILAALGRIDWDKLDYARKLDLARVYAVALHRFGTPDSSAIADLTSRFDARFPGKGRELNVELANLLVFLEAPSAPAKIVPMMENAPTQEEQMDLARTIRVATVGWTPELRRAYFSWFSRAGDFKGGPSLGGFLNNIKTDAVATLSPAEKAELKPILDAPPRSKGTTAATSATRAFVKNWTLDELVPVVETGLKSKRDFDRGRSLFAATSCFACHRYDNEGGAIGPDLTGVAGRFSPRDLLESIILPSKVISDQYEAVIISTTDGKTVTGRIMNLHNDRITINTNMLDPSAQVDVDATKIEETRPSAVSMMPEGLLSTLDRDEVIDLVAYVLSRGDRDAKMFK